MQPPPRTGPPGASGPPPSGPNMFRRTRPPKQTSAAALSGAMAPALAPIPPASQPMTDPFAFARTPPPPMAAGGVPTVSNSNPQQFQTPPTSVYSQPGAGPPPQPQTLQDAPPGPPPSSLPGVTLFNPQGPPPPGVFVAPPHHGEQGYFNSDQAPSASAESPPVAVATPPTQTPFNQEFHGHPPNPPHHHHHHVPFQPLPPSSSSSSSQWAPDHSSRPPSVQNYFQPTSDPQPQPLNIAPHSQMYPSHSPSPYQNAPTPPTQPGNPQNQAPAPLQNPGRPPSSQWSDPNAPQPHNPHFQSYFSQVSAAAPPDPWFGQQPPHDSGYHQMGTGLSTTPPRPPPGSDPSLQESGSLSMFFSRDSDVENEETLAGERSKAVNGVAESFPNPPPIPTPPPLGPGHQPPPHPPPPDGSGLPYLNEGSHLSPGNAQRPPEGPFDHVENLECVPNQEVLPSEGHAPPPPPPPPAPAAAVAVDQFETGPNLETPDSAPRPVRSSSVSSSYSNLSHGRGVVGTFIQQESPRLADDEAPPPPHAAVAGGYFEQIDTSSSSEQAWAPTPSPPKPTGVFQASPNSSFEPVRSHAVGVRPAEVDRAKMVAEGGGGGGGGADFAPGNLEQPPDNMENIYGPGQPPPGLHAHSRPSSRAFGATRPCESPATTLWAQNDPASLGANILLAPAAPPAVLAPLREPSADVIQPPEDGPLDLQPPQRAVQQQQHSENLENPPKVSEAGPADPHGAPLGYASLLLSGSLHQPVLIAPPVSNYSVIAPPGNSPQSAAQSNPRDITPPERSQPPQAPSNQNALFSGQGPLNLTRENVESAKPETTPPPAPPARPPLSRSQSSSGDVQMNAQASSPPPPSVSNHNRPSNYELLDFSMHQSHAQQQPPAPGPPPVLHESPQSSNGFYLQVTKDSQQGNAAPPPAQAPPPRAPPPATSSQPLPGDAPRTPDPQQGQREAPPPTAASGAQPPPTQYPAAPAVGGGAPVAPAVYPPGPRGPPQPPPAEPPRPPSTAGSLHGYGPPPPAASGQPYAGYYGNYGEGPDSRAPYPAPPGQYGPPPADPRAQPYYQDGPYRGRADPWYGRYEGQTQAYRDPNYQYREPQPDRPSSRASQYSDRPSSRQGYADDYHRANRSAYSDYYADYSKHYDYGGYNYGQYDPRLRGYYDQSYWPYYDEAYRNSYYNQQAYPARKEGYEDQWRYCPGYDSSFDEEGRRGRDPDDFDRRSVHSEQSAHSAHSSHSQHSRRSSFSSRSQQSQVYRSQPDLVSGVYDPTASTLVDYSYGQYPNPADASQDYSQYMYPSEYTENSTWIAPEQPPPRPATPEKFTMPHRCARFGPGGHLVQILPNLPSAGQPALVDIYNMETMLQDTSDQAELRAFPGPLLKEETHKVDVIKFSQNKALECARDNNLLDRDSARLLWDFIVLLCRQNGTVVGTDIADLLLKEHRSVWLPGKSPNEANLIDFTNEPLARAEEEPGAGPLSLLSDTFMTVPENVGKETERFRELLLFGRKKDALEAAMKGGLWGHALLLASKMDSRTHARVMTRFANSLPMNDPLQTIYQLMSGRMPASATCCGEEKWGDWRPHLAMVLSNLTHTLDLDTRTITTMGDTLASKGLTDAAHFCYMMAQVGLGVFTKKSTKMVLIGSNHSLSFSKFASNEAIQRTEAYEYAQSLGSQPCSLPNFQVFKLIYASRLAEAGLCAQAFHYCEVISKTVLTQPSFYSPVFISQIIQMSEKLRFFDPQLKERPEQELFIEPDWLVHLRQLDGQIRTGVIAYNVDRTTPAQFDCNSEGSDFDQPTPPEPYGAPGGADAVAPDNPLMTSLLPGPQQQGVRLMPPAPTSILQDGMSPPQLLPPNDPPQFYPVPPSGPPGHLPMPGLPPQDPGFAPPPFQPQPDHQPEAYPGAHQQPFPPPQMGHMSPHTHPPQLPHSPVQMNPPPPQHMGSPPPQHMGPPPLHSTWAPPPPQHMGPSPGHMTPMEQPFQSQGPPEMHPQQISSSPTRSAFPPPHGPVRPHG
ncbi:LOW QUALITY PROTEIN: protein transport protein Sec16A [Menidia menidia]